MKTNVCFVLPSLHGGGAERAAVKVLNGLNPASYETTLYLFRREGAYLRDLGSSVRLVGPGGGPSPLERLLELRRFFKASAPDIVVTFLSHFSVFLATRLARVPSKFVISQQTPLSAFLSDRDYRWRRPGYRQLFAAVARSVYPRADLVAAASRGVADDLVQNFGVRPERIRILHNPVDLAEIAARSREPIDDEDLRRDQCSIIVTAGRLAEAKNLPLLIESLKLLAARLPIQAFILGEGEQEGRVRQAIAEAGLNRSVHLRGFQRNPWRYMACADAFVLTSRYEGFGNVIVEAMACGVPVVATSSYGTRELIQSGSNGILVETHEAASVAEALHRVLTNRALRDRLVANAAVSTKEFALSTVVMNYEAAFHQLCDAREPACA